MEQYVWQDPLGTLRRLEVSSIPERSILRTISPLAMYATTFEAVPPGQADSRAMPIARGGSKPAYLCQAQHSQANAQSRLLESI